LRAVEYFVDLNAALGRDDVLERSLRKAALRADDIDVLFLLEEHQRLIDDVEEGQLDAVRELLAGQRAGKVDMLKGELGDEAHAQPGLFD
jgi:hypothetical protein